MKGFLSRPRRRKITPELLPFLPDCNGSRSERFTCWDRLLVLHSFPLCQRAEFTVLDLEGQLIF